MDIPIGQKKCATCRWWSGKREVVFVGVDPKYIRIAGILPGSNCRAWPDKRPYFGTATCFRWSKWERL